jgi:hypothetical protein
MAQAKRRKSPVVTRAQSVKTRKIEWWWRNRIPKGQIVIIAGRPDQGKGLYACHLAAELSHEHKIIHSSWEDDYATMLAPRYRAAGARMGNVLLWQFKLPSDDIDLTGMVLEHRPAIVVLDPLSAHLDRRVSKYNDSIRSVTTPMQKLAEKTGTTFIVIEHALKKVAKGAHPLAAIGGTSSGLPAASRMAYLFGQDPHDEERCVLCCVKSNLRRKPKPLEFELDTKELAKAGETPYLMYKGETKFRPMALLHDSFNANVSATGMPRGRPPVKRAEAAEWLVGYLAEGPIKQSKCLEDGLQHNLSQNTIKRAAEDIRLVKKPPGGGKGCTWELPAALAKRMAARG